MRNSQISDANPKVSPDHNCDANHNPNLIVTSQTARRILRIVWTHRQWTT